MNRDWDSVEADEALVRRFRDMRTQDAVTAPEFPAHTAPAQLRFRRLGRSLHSALVQGAVAASVLVVAGLLISERSLPQDPAALYTDIMAGYQLTTDELLYVSSSIAPEMQGLPDVLELGLPALDQEAVN